MPPPILPNYQPLLTNLALQAPSAYQPFKLITNHSTTTSSGIIAPSSYHPFKPQTTQLTKMPLSILPNYQPLLTNLAPQAQSLDPSSQSHQSLKKKPASRTNLLR